jgi:hypothetical protein
MKSEYVKIKCSFKERLLFLFTSLICKDYLINNTYNDNIRIELSDEMKKVTPVPITKKQEPEIIPDKIDIPFFELDNSDDTEIVSNLK